MDEKNNNIVRGVWQDQTPPPPGQAYGSRANDEKSMSAVENSSLSRIALSFDACILAYYLIVNFCQEKSYKKLSLDYHCKNT